MFKKLIGFSCLLIMSNTLVAQKTYPVKDFFKNAEKTRFQISPDGDQLSYLAPWNNRMNIHVVPINGTTPVRVTSLTDRDINGYFWKNNTSIIYVRDFGGDENFHLFLASTDGKTEKDLTPFKDVRVSITDQLEDFPNEVLIEMNKENPEVFDVYRMNITTGDMKLVAKNPGNI